MTAQGIRARPTVYKGVQMRSRLEADFASALDRDGETWEYEPTCFGGPGGQWLPDFSVYNTTTVYVEVKPASLAKRSFSTDRVAFDPYERVDAVLRKMSVAWLSEPGCLLQLVLWEYGLETVADSPLTIYGYHRGGAEGVWTVHDADRNLDLPMLWMGMGQYLRCWGFSPDS